MSDSATQARVSMVRPHWDGLPVIPPPAGYSLRFYRPGDAATWTRIQEEAERVHKITPELFWHEFGAGETQLPQRQIYLCDTTGRAMGTATAWFEDQYHGGSWGRLHWVAVCEACQGRGLGRVLVSAACQRLVELGHVRAFLRTQPTRVRAIRLYVGFGFVPEIRHDADRREWEALQRQGLNVDLATERHAP